MRKLFLLILAALTLAAPAALAGGGSGLPVPRFVSLKSDETNVRSGPGTRYPIQWVYRRSGTPVEVVEEYDLWRKIRDVEGATGWVHKSMLEGKRHVIIKGGKAQLIKSDPETDARSILKAEPMVQAALIECLPEWCRIQLSARKGWLEKKYLWGVYPEEVFE